MKKSLFISAFALSFYSPFTLGKSCVTINEFTSNSSLISTIKNNSKHFLNGNCLVKKLNSPIERTNFSIVSYLLERKTVQNYDSNDCLETTSLSFDELDQNDHEWRPQGVAVQNDLGFVSWYHRLKVNGQITNQNGELGMRLSIIDLKTGAYNHFLLLDKDENRIIGHADGLAVQDNLLFVADYNFGLHIFDLNKINTYNKSIKRLGFLSTQKCRFPIYQMANLSLTKEKLLFTPYQQNSNRLNLFEIGLNDILTKDRIGTKMIHQQLPFKKVQGIGEISSNEDSKYIFLSQKDDKTSHLSLSTLNADSKNQQFILPAGIEDAEVVNNVIYSVTEFEKRKSFLLIKIKE
ncbi:MAG: hypothetical protein GY909_09900 [Oligoflexia bacterium]|nr:hypothetical protein [Oligoflexia bacterium]